MSPNGAILLQGSEIKQQPQIQQIQQIQEVQQVEQPIENIELTTDNNNNLIDDNDMTIEYEINEPPPDNLLLSPINNNNNNNRIKKLNNYELLDPYSDDNYQNKPIKIMKTYTEYSHLKDNYNLKLQHPNSINNFNKNSKNIFYNYEFKLIYDKEQKNKRKERIIKLRNKYNNNNTSIINTNILPIDPITSIYENNNEDLDDDDEDNDFDNINNNIDINIDPFDNNNNNNIENIFTEIDNSLSYEELCRKHVKAFMSGAEAYAIETQLTKRVNDWQSKIEPLLEEEVKHPEFNIHNYGEMICNELKSLNNKEKVMSFNDLVKECDNYEICRKFLSVLMMANENRVIIECDKRGGIVDNKFIIKYNENSENNNKNIEIDDFDI